ncbi:hypothetical protein ABW21_db0205708 [Orbilia brochopaga]|nr:hypothetical protein ABW21_db0205708 [Drechslerella brochopaga]
MVGTTDNPSTPPPAGAIATPTADVVAAPPSDAEVSPKRKVSLSVDITHQPSPKRQRLDMTPPPRPTSTDAFVRPAPPRCASLPPNNKTDINFPPPSAPLSLVVSSTSDKDILPSTDTTVSMPPPQPTYLPVQPQRGEVLQFSATDLPMDDEGMARWLANKVRDSATTQHNLDISAGGEHSPDAGGVESDPETRAERERVRAENRERKKKWREENSDRNKDNDLRGRVSRRANKLFGAENSDKKREWMENEFNRRKMKREFKTQLKKNETPGSSCWNANDDFTDNPSIVMAGVLTSQEGAVENFRNWLENGDVDWEIWTAACQKIWGDPTLRARLEGWLPPIDIGSGAGGQGERGDGKNAVDGLASKFDAAFDAIIGRPPKPSMMPPPIPQAAETPDIDTMENIPNEVENMETEATVPAPVDPAEAEGHPESLDQLTEEALQEMIASGEMSMEDIAALEAALRDETYEEEAQMLGSEIDAEAAVEQTDSAMPDLHADHADISDLHLQLDMMSPSTRDTFLATIMGQTDGAGAIDEMKLDDTAAVESAEQPDANEEAAAADGAGDDGSVLDLLASAGINLDDLSEEQLQKFINAVSGEGDIDEVLTGIQAQQEAAHTVVDPDQSTAALPSQSAQDINTDENMELNALDEEAGNSGDDFDDSDEIDLTPDIMRIILEQSNYTSLLGGKSLDDMAGDAHTLQPKPSVPVAAPQPAPTRTPARQTYPMIQQQRQQQQQQLEQQRQQQQQYQSSYSISSYGGNYTYSYERRPEVQILPPGYSAYQRPPMPAPQRQQPRFTEQEMLKLLSPLQWLPTPATIPTMPATDGGKKTGWTGTPLTSFLEFRLPIPEFIKCAYKPVDPEREKYRKSFGFPPPATEVLKELLEKQKKEKEMLEQEMKVEA